MELAGVSATHADIPAFVTAAAVELDTVNESMSGNDGSADDTVDRQLLFVDTSGGVFGDGVEMAVSNGSHAVLHPTSDQLQRLYEMLASQTQNFDQTTQVFYFALS